MMIKLLCLAVIIVFVIDLSGFMDTVKRWIWKWLVKDRPYREYSLKPFDCSMCMTHHICVLFALIGGFFSLEIWTFICVLSLLTRQIKGVLELMGDILIKIENGIRYILNI